MTKKKTSAAKPVKAVAQPEAPDAPPPPPVNKPFLVRMSDGAIIPYSDHLSRKPGFQVYHGDPSKYVHRAVPHVDDQGGNRPITLEMLHVHAAALGYKLVPIGGAAGAPTAVLTSGESKYTRTEDGVIAPQTTLDTNTHLNPAPPRAHLAPADDDVPEHVAAEIAELRAQSDEELRSFARGYGVEFDAKAKRVTIVNKCIDLLKENLVEA